MQSIIYFHTRFNISNYFWWLLLVGGIEYTLKKFLCRDKIHDNRKQLTGCLDGLKWLELITRALFSIHRHFKSIWRWLLVQRQNNAFWITDKFSKLVKTSLKQRNWNLSNLLDGICSRMLQTVDTSSSTHPERSCIPCMWSHRVTAIYNFVLKVF